MKTRYVAHALLIRMLFCLSPGCVDGTNETKDRQTALAAIVASVGEETGVPGVAVYVRSEKHGEFSTAWGDADLEAGTAVTAAQPFRIGSLTKSFTAAAVLKLAEADFIDLDAPITEYLGTVNNYTPLSEISVRQLMNMSSGLAPYLVPPFLTDVVLADPLQHRLPEVLLSEAFAAAPELLFTPGSDFLYTNTNYILLGMLIEEISGRSYEEVLQTEFFSPLGLTATFVAVDATIPADTARGYFDYDEDGRYEDWTEMDMSFVWSAGCIISNARDVAVWMDALARGELINPALHSDLFGGRTIGETAVYGAGIVVESGFGIGHNGTVIGYHADAWYDPDSGTTAAVLSNTNAPLGSDDIDPTRAIAEEVLLLFKE